MLPSGILVSPEQLAGQLDHMLRYHKAVTAHEIASAMACGELPKNSFSVTFDDGFRGQHDVALSILEARGVQGMFFVPTCIVNDRHLPTVERQRLLQYSNGPYEDFYTRFTLEVAERCPELAESAYAATPQNLQSALSYYAEYHFYSPMERLYRKVRETMLPNETFEAIIEAMFADAFKEEEIITRHFLNWDDLRRMRDRGHHIGGHGHKHLLESNIDGRVAAADHLRSVELLRNNLGFEVTSYAYPYGIFQPETVDALAGVGVEIAFTCRAGIGFDGSPLLIDRYDCKAFPFNANANVGPHSVAEMKTTRGACAH
jgi:peptidoglycan/xylan/chitin deacetylase (PgdA/CDA1 family)